MRQPFPVEAELFLWQSISGWPSEYSSPLRFSVSYCLTQISNLQLMQCFTNKINRDECRSQASDISESIFQNHFQIWRYLIRFSLGEADGPSYQNLNGFFKMSWDIPQQVWETPHFLEGFRRELKISETFWKGANPQTSLLLWTFQNSLCIVFTYDYGDWD